MNHSQQAQAPYEDEAALRKLSEQDDPDVNEAVRDKFQRRSTRKRKEPDRFAPSAPESDLVVAYGDDPAEVTTSTTASGLTNGGQRIPLRTPPKTPEKRALDPVDQSVNESGAGPAFSAKKPRIQESNQQELDHSGANHHDLRSAAKLPQPLQLVSDQIVDSGSVSGMTFRAADLACELHGEDLTEAAQRAQNAGLIKSDVDVNSLRFVHDEWMIPMKCQHCLPIRQSRCNRAQTCKRCTTKNLVCDCHDPDHLMEFAKLKSLSARVLSKTNLRGAGPEAVSAEEAPEVRPEPQGKPEVWARSRQALCETLPYYQSYQGGGYTFQNHCYGFLVDGHGHSRDLVDANVVITRAGGGLKKDSFGNMIAAKDQCEESAQCKAIQKNILHKKPVVIILGEEHRKAPSQPVAPYSVLGWFKPTHVWIEKDDRHYFYKYRFEKYNLNEISWWVPKDQQPTIPMEERPAPDVKVCPSCEQPSPGIYSEAWVCLNEICEDFWVPEHGICAEDLTYSPNFLQQSTPWPGWEVPYPIKPEFVFDDAGVYDTSIAARKGFVCPECSMCNSRTHWSTLVCSNVEGGCTFTRNVTPNVVNPKSLADPNRLVGVGHTDPLNTMDKDKVSAVVERSPEPVDGFRVHTYDIEGCGQIVHFISNNNINRRKGGADDMFHDMQTADVGLERRKMPSNKMKGSSYTNQFSLNFGMHYEYYVDVPSRSFDDSCDAIRSARTALNWAGRYVVGNQHFHEFNELLALGYFERQRMNYHDDGETGLGPTIATLSLGYPATMTLRMKSKYYTGFTKGGAYYTASPPIPGSIKYEERKEAHAMLDGVRSQAERQKIGEKILKKLQLDNKRRNCPPLVTMNLRHGDIVIMHGFNLQKYYEHAVESQETIRFALTCRYVDPRSVKPELRPRPDVADSGIDPIAVDVNDTNFEHLAMLPTPTETAPDDSEELAASSDSSELSSVMSVEDVDFSD